MIANQRIALPALIIILFLATACAPTTGEPGFAAVAGRDVVAAQEYSLSIPLYVKRNAPNGDTTERSLPELWAAWEEEGSEFWQEMGTLVEMLDGLNEE